MSNQLKLIKSVAGLPEALEPNVIYFNRTGKGFDLYVSDLTGNMAHKINVPEHFTISLLEFENTVVDEDSIYAISDGYLNEFKGV